MFKVQRKLTPPSDSLSVMKIRNITTAAERRLAWRNRFLEIGRLAEVAAATQVFAARALRPRARMAGFAVVRRARPASPGML